MYTTKISIVFFLFLASVASFGQSGSLEETLLKIEYLSVENPRLSIKEHSEIYKKARQQDDAEAMMKSQYQIASSYHYLAQKENVLLHSKILMELAQSEENWYFVSQALKMRAYAVGFVEPYSECRKILKKAFTYSEKIKDKQLRIKSDAHLHYMMSHMFYRDSLTPIDSAYRHARKSIELYKKIPGYSSNKYLGEVFTHYGECFVTEYKMDSAQFYLKKGLAIAIENRNLHGKILAFSAMGDAAYFGANDALAIEQYLKAIEIAKSYGNKIELSRIYSNVSDAYSEIRDYKNAQHYLTLRNKLNLEMEPEATKSYKKVVEILAQDRAEEVEEQSGNSTLAVTIALVLLIVLLLVFYFSFKKFRRHSDTKETLQKKLSEQESELQVLKTRKAQDLKKLVKMARDNDPLLLGRAKQLLPDFFTKLLSIEPNLTLLEQRFCVYLLLQFSTNEIANHTGISVKSVQNKKNRIRKRLFLNNAQDLYEFMKNLAD